MLRQRLRCTFIPKAFYKPSRDNSDKWTDRVLQEPYYSDVFLKVLSNEFDFESQLLKVSLSAYGTQKQKNRPMTPLESS